jgi:hypothetical protein
MTRSLSGLFVLIVATSIARAAEPAKPVEIDQEAFSRIIAKERDQVKVLLAEERAAKDKVRADHKLAPKIKRAALKKIGKDHAQRRAALQYKTRMELRRVAVK